jgi:hypothetical protein
MKPLLLCLALALAGPLAAAAEPAKDGAAALTVSAAGLNISGADLILSGKPSTLFLLWDAFPYRDALHDGDPAQRLAVVKDLIDGYALKRNPQALRVKVTVVEFTERDSYGAPRYDQVHVLQTFVADVDPKTGKAGPARPLPTP